MIPELVPSPLGAEDYEYARWMGDLVLSEAERRRGTDAGDDPKGSATTAAAPATLGSLVIPGSHDSASYSIPKETRFSSIGTTQNLGTREQLLMGIRFLDLRIAAGSGHRERTEPSPRAGVCVCHGVLVGCPLGEVLGDVRSFCRDFPTELVILHVVPEHGRFFPPLARQKSLDALRSCFCGSGSSNENENDNININNENININNENIINNENNDMILRGVSSVQELLDKPLRDLVEGPSRICVLLHPRFYEGFVVGGVEHTASFVEREYGFFDSSGWLRDKWHDTNDTKLLLEANLREIRKRKRRGQQHHRGSGGRQEQEEHQELLVNSQFVLTPSLRGAAGRDLAGLCLGRTSFLEPLAMVHGGGLYSYRTQRSKLAPGRRRGWSRWRGASDRRDQPPALHTFWSAHAGEDWNLVSLDFVDLVPAVVGALIGSNSGRLEVLLAVRVRGGGDAGGDDDAIVCREEQRGRAPARRRRKRTARDITSTVRSSVLRGSCLFWDPRTDDGSEGGGETETERDGKTETERANGAVSSTGGGSTTSNTTSTTNSNTTSTTGNTSGSIAGSLLLVYKMHGDGWYSVVIPFDTATTSVVLLHGQNHIRAGGTRLLVEEEDESTKSTTTTEPSSGGTVRPRGVDGMVLAWTKSPGGEGRGGGELSFGYRFEEGDGEPNR